MILYTYIFIIIFIIKIVTGDHTRTVNIATPTIGGLMKFAVVTATCLGCKSPLPKGGKYIYTNYYYYCYQRFYYYCD